MPSEGWALELRGDPFDLGDIRHDLALPFDPWSEDFEEDGRTLLLLRTHDWDALETSGSVMERASALVEQLNGARSLVYHDARQVSLGAIYRFDNAGRRMPVTIELSAHATLTARMRARLSALREGEAPPPPEQSDTQRYLDLTRREIRASDALIFIARMENWFDLYKAVEILNQLGGARNLEREFVQWNLVKRTANAHRHAPGTRNDPPDPPATLAEAQALVREVAAYVLQRQ